MPLEATSTLPRITRVSGPIVTACGMRGAQMYEVVEVGELGLIGEVVRIIEDRATIQVYEDTTMLKAGAPIRRTGAPLSISLGPGLVGNIYDGIERPLRDIQARSGAWIARGEKTQPLDARKRWPFEPLVAAGKDVTAGQTLADVVETPLVHHRVMVPPGVAGRLKWIAGKGEYTIEDRIAVIETADGERPLTMVQRWPVRQARPIRQRLRVSEPLVTGQRIIDTFFPLGKGGTAAIPGGFGTGKTITQQQLAKWSDAQVIVYIGCGERGNEMTEVLREFPELKDPRSGRPLMERTILIANTSNMPVAAREVSIYTGITLAEYYRDMGLDVAVFADSTSRWGRVPGVAAGAAGPVLRARRGGDDAGRRAGVGQHRRGRQPAGRRLLGARHPAHAAVHPVLLGAGHRTGQRPPLSLDPLAAVLLRVRRGRGLVVGQTGAGVGRTAGRGHDDPPARGTPPADRETRRARRAARRPAADPVRRRGA
jgi:vacuolar-type H+-ATPase catalytic subunit A/Vma1